MDDGTQVAAAASDALAPASDIPGESPAASKKKPARKKRKALPGDDGGDDQSKKKKVKKKKVRRFRFHHELEGIMYVIGF